MMTITPENLSFHPFTQWCERFTDNGAPRIPLLMGILNSTPDSFYDKSRVQTAERATARARDMLADGVSIIDIGGESTRPGSQPVSCDEELSRVIPAIQAIRQLSDVWISVDTSRPEVMREAVAAGADIINDVMGLSAPGARAAAAGLQVPVCIVHMRGTPATMQDNPRYTGDILAELDTFFETRIAECVAAGIRREYLILDPGFGFGKTVAHNLRMTACLAHFARHDLPLLLGVSRKSTFGELTGLPPEERLPASLAATCFAMQQGVNIIRTHDVAQTRQALQITGALMGAQTKYQSR